MKTNWVILGFILLIIGAVADVVSTILCTQAMGVEYEANPIIRAVLQEHGGAMLIILKAMVLIFIAWAYLHYREDEYFMRWCPRIIYVGAVFWIALGINNFYIMHECGMITLNILTIVI